MASMIFFMLIFGSFEFGRVYMLRHDMDSASYEAARLAALPGTSSEDVEEFAREFLERVGAVEAKFDIDASAADQGGDTVTVTITLPLDQYGWLTPALARGGSITRSCTLAAEKGAVSPKFQQTFGKLDLVSLLNLGR